MAKEKSHKETTKALTDAIESKTTHNKNEIDKRNKEKQGIESHAKRNGQNEIEQELEWAKLLKRKNT